jgi:multiple sugar transport system permease protein
MATAVQKLSQTKKEPGLLGRMWKYRFAYLLILPTLLIMLIIHAMPIVQGFIMSLLDINGAAKMRLFLNAPFVGLENYQALLLSSTNATGATIMGAARNTFFYTIIVNILTLGLGLVSALLLNRKFRFQRVARTLLLLPWIVPTYAVGLMWANMWLSETGVINNILVDWLHLFPADDRPFWLIGPNAFWAVVVPTVWRGLPFNTVMLMAGLQIIPEDLYEAADVDGASAWQKFRYITAPLLKPTLAIMLLWGVIFTAFGYNIVVMMFGNGGGFPGESADLLMPALQRQTFSRFNFGLGAAMSIMMMAIMMVFVGIWLRVFRDSLTTEGSAK